ncbi:TonB-dependent receptor [Phenylobacterium montanum]|uniref:TonB-dependent receptor n=1 Tax=Phenylobacterium montanum TaxID=2823693 RepID=A0A975FZE5_9CAUL|nr:TonB-dependent receptor [Caulobacter sp. S6]QUD88303.1 TonB-dependent receptor [Caulobacter sp. S6]
MGASLVVLGAPTLAAAQTAAPAAAAAAAATNEVVVYGRGQVRQIETLTPKQIEQAVPGTSAIKVLATLPGVNYQSSDSFGAYEWATRISVRGFNQNQLGFTLDGVPLGDMSYGNDNGLHISRAISSENIGKTELAQGAGALGTASSSNLGGTIEFTSRDPSHEFGALGALTYGTWDTQHEFVRVDTGDVMGGGRGYFSFGNQRANKWKGDGRQQQQQFNSKWVQPVGPVTFTAFFNYSDRKENDYQDLSLGLIKNFGYKLDNISNNWPAAVALANGYEALVHGADPSTVTFPLGLTLANTGPATDPWDAVYFNGSGLRKDALGGIKADWEITDNLSAHIQGYGHHNTGQGTWDTPYTPSPGYTYGDPNSTGAPISIRTTEYDIARGGVIGAINYKIAGHDIEAGFWYEDNHFNEARRFYALDANGDNRNNLNFQQSPFFTQWYGKFDTTTTEFHLQDTWRVTDQLKLYAGFKSLDADSKADQTVGTRLPSGEIKASDGFLPQAGVNFRIDGSNEVFADYAKNMRAFQASNTQGPFSTTKVGFALISGTLKPETSQTGEIGYRYHNSTLEGVITAYYVKFDHRLLTIPQGSIILGAASALANVGSVTSKGVEIAGDWKFMHNWSLNVSYAYDDSTYDNDVISTASGTPVVVMHTSGKTVIDAPKNIANLSVNYDDGSLFGSVDFRYMSKRYFTYENDQSVGSQSPVDLTLGYRFHASDGWLKGVDVQVNVTNLFDEKYVATVGTNGFTARGDYQTLQAAAPTEAFVTLRKQF